MGLPSLINRNQKLRLVLRKVYANTLILLK